MKKKEVPVQEEVKPVAEPSKKRGRPVKAAEDAKPSAKTSKPAKSADKPKAKKSVAPKSELAVEPMVVKTEPVKVEPKIEKSVEPKPAVEKKKFTLNQEFNVLIGFLAIALILVLCVNFQTGGEKLSGWELILHSGLYSGVFKGLMVFYVITLFIDCALAVKIDSENKYLNIIEEVLYAITLTANIIVGAILFILVKNIGLGLIVFGILSLVSVLIKIARIYTKQG